LGLKRFERSEAVERFERLELDFGIWVSAAIEQLEPA
jgi:hypothetical protein